MFAAAMAMWTVMSLPDFIDPRGKPVGYDFMAFWSASWLALQGEAAAAYDPATILTAHNAAIPGVENYYLWHYPPTYFLTVLPLAFLPYLVALAAFLAVSIWTWAVIVRRLLPMNAAKWPLLALPAVMICVVHGQNGLLTAALLGAALLMLDKRALLAGVLIGLLAIKPHLGLFIPVALAASGRWRTFVSAGVTVGVFCALSTAVFGIEIWRTFFDNLHSVRGYLDSTWLPWAMIPTPYVMARSMGFIPDMAMAVQLLVAAVAGYAVWRIWRSPEASFNIKAAGLCAASMLISPYMFYYDMTILSLAGIWLVREGLQSGFRPGERSWLAIAWSTPLLMGSIYGLTGVQPAVVATLALVWIAYRRAVAPDPIAAAEPGRTPTLSSHRGPILGFLFALAKGRR